MKRLTLAILAALLLSSCDMGWTPEQTAKAWNSAAKPLTCVSGSGNTMTCYFKWWFVDAGGNLVRIEGYDLSFEPGAKYDRLPIAQDAGREP